MFRVHRCLSVMMCRDFEWDVLHSTETVGLLIRIWAPAPPGLLRNECFHGRHETCSLLVVMLNCSCAVIISDQAYTVVPQQHKTCNSVRTENAKQIETT